MLRSFAISLLLAGCCFAQFPGETDRLMATAKLWVTVEYFHPYLAYRDIDWDQALVKAIPKIRAAKSTDEYRAAVSGMLEELHDPETHLFPDGFVGPQTSVPVMSLARTAGSTSFVIRLGVPSESKFFLHLPGFEAAVRQLEPVTTIQQSALLLSLSRTIPTRQPKPACLQPSKHGEPSATSSPTKI